MRNKKTKKLKKLTLELTLSDWIASAILILLGLLFMYIAFSMVSGQHNQISTLNGWLDSKNNDTSEIVHLVKKDMYLTNGFIRVFFTLSYMCFLLLAIYFVIALLRTRNREKKSNTIDV